MRVSKPVAVLVILASLVALALVAYRSIGSLEETKRSGDLIVKALGKFRAEHNRYPLTLAELCPTYLETIPTPIWGLRVWNYQRTPGGDFYLGVNEDEHTGDGNSHWFRYLGPTHGWQIGD
jgi:hypothetical protein